MPEAKKVILTTIERLNAERKGLQLDVDLWLDGGVSCQEISVRLLKQYGLPIPEKTISNYRIRRYLPARARVKGLCELRDSITGAVKKYKTGELAEAFIYERLGEALDAGEKVSLPIILRELREWGKQQLDAERLKLDTEQLEQDKKSLEVKIQQLEKERQAVTQKTEKLIEKRSGELSPEIVADIRQTIYGLPVAQASLPAPPEEQARMPALL